MTDTLQFPQTAQAIIYLIMPHKGTFYYFWKVVFFCFIFNGESSDVLMKPPQLHMLFFNLDDLMGFCRI